MDMTKEMFEEFSTDSRIKYAKIKFEFEFNYVYNKETIILNELLDERFMDNIKNLNWDELFGYMHSEEEKNEQLANLNKRDIIIKTLINNDLHKKPILEAINVYSKNSLSTKNDITNIKQLKGCVNINVILYDVKINEIQWNLETNKIS